VVDLVHARLVPLLAGEVEQRPNLAIITTAQATRILLDGMTFDELKSKFPVPIFDVDLDGLMRFLS